MPKREISGSGRIKASIFIDGRSMMKDRSKSNTGSRLVLEIKWIAFLVISSLQSGHCSLELFNADRLDWFDLLGIRNLRCRFHSIWVAKSKSDSPNLLCFGSIPEIDEHMT